MAYFRYNQSIFIHLYTKIEIETNCYNVSQCLLKKKSGTT